MFKIDNVPGEMAVGVNGLPCMFKVENGLPCMLKVENVLEMIPGDMDTGVNCLCV